MLGEWELESGRLVIKYKCEFFTYKTHWDEFKEEFDLTDEELRKLISQCLQINAWADILDDVRAGLE